ncbi:MAG: glycoside hydrolase family 76 protein [Fimbriimonadaceae bacterium]
MVLSLMTLCLARSGPAEWGATMLETIRRDYYLSDSRLYSERADKQQPAFNWGVGVMLSALNSAARYDGKYKTWLRDYADATRSYWNGHGYDVLPGPKPSDLYYDDNAWMALALVETHDVLGDAKYLEWAKEALAFSLSGESREGGVFWRESDKASRNTCSCGPTAVACIAVSRHTKDASLTARAKRIVEWTKDHLEDPEDALYWDSLSNGGKVEKAKWSYNSALMIQAMRGLDIDGWKATLDSSKKKWLVEGGIADPGRFAHLLLETWIKAGAPDPAYAEALGTIWKARSARGHVPPYWSTQDVPENPELLDQAAFVRACFFLAANELSESG